LEFSVPFQHKYSYIRDEQDVEKFSFLRFLEKNAPLRENFLNAVPKGFIATDRRVVFKFREIWPTGNR